MAKPRNGMGCLVIVGLFVAFVVGRCTTSYTAPPPTAPAQPLYTATSFEDSSSSSSFSASVRGRRSHDARSSRAKAHHTAHRHDPAPESNGATAICRDGSESYSAHRSGTCSHHGGVAQWL